MSVDVIATETLETGPWLSIGPARSVTWTRYHLAIPGLSSPEIRLLHLSDLHIRTAISPLLKRVAEQIASDPPDATLMTGDFVDDKLDHASAIPLLEEIVPRLKGRLGLFAILGNHDSDLLGGHLTRLGVTDISGRIMTVCDAQGQKRVRLLGLPGVAREEPAPVLDSEAETNLPTIALTHYPDFSLRVGRVRPHVTLAGHTHGGQICLPGGLALMTHDSLPRRMCRGCHKVAGHVLIVSCGLGTTRLPVRLFAPPDVIELVIRPG